MGRETSITQEQVNQAADAIQAGGGKPTARAIREQLGTGSMATVLKFLNVWQEKQIRPSDVPISLPQGLVKAIADFVSQEVSGAKAGLQADLVIAQQANGDLIAECERQTSTVDFQARALESLQAERATLAGRVGQMESDLAIAKEEAALERQAAETARTETAKSLLRLEAMPRLEADIDRLQAELEKERAARVYAEQNAAVLAAKLEAEITAEKKAESAISDLSKQLDEARKQTQTLMESLSHERVSVQAANARLEAAARELVECKAATKEAKADAKTAAEIAAELRGELAAVKGDQIVTPTTKKGRTP